MKKFLFVIALFIQSFNIILAEEGPCPDSLLGDFTHKSCIIALAPCPGQQNSCAIELKYSVRVVKDQNNVVISREIMIEDYTITRCDCYDDIIKETILRACFMDAEDFEITEPGTYTNIKVFSKSCYRQEISPLQYFTAFIPCEGIVCCKIEYSAMYVPSCPSGGCEGLRLENLIKISPPQVQINACYNTCVFTCNDWPIFVDNNPNTAPDIDVTYPPGPLSRISGEEIERAESIVISKGNGTSGIILEKILMTNGEILNIDNKISGIIIYSVEGQVLFQTQKTKGLEGEFSAFADNLDNGVYFIESKGKTSNKVYKIIITD